MVGLMIAMLQFVEIPECRNTRWELRVSTRPAYGSYSGASAGWPRNLPVYGLRSPRSPPFSLLRGRITDALLPVTILVHNLHMKVAQAHIHCLRW
jgi:hypothetical protein